MQTIVRTLSSDDQLDVKVDRSWWLWLTVPICALATAGSVIGIVVDDIYAKETPNWGAQGVGQDIGNLVAFPVLMVLAYLAGRGSLRAHLASAGVLAYSVYTYAIYAFDIHFGPLFLLYVAVFGLSIWAFIGSLGGLDVGRVKESFDEGTPVRLTSSILIVIGGAFSLLWLSEIVPAILGGTTPESLAEAGLTSSPVHVLDLGVLLPAAVGGGVLLRRGRPWGYVLAPVVLGALVFLSIGIIAAMTVLAGRGEDGSLGVVGFLSVLALLEIFVWVRFLRSVHPEGIRAATRSLERRSTQ